MTPSLQIYRGVTIMIHSSNSYLVSRAKSKRSKVQVDIFYTWRVRWHASYADRHVEELKAERSVFSMRACEVNKLQCLCFRLWLSSSSTTPQRDDTSRTSTCFLRRWVRLRVLCILIRTSQSLSLWQSNQVTSRCSTQQMQSRAAYAHCSVSPCVILTMPVHCRWIRCQPASGHLRGPPDGAHRRAGQIPGPQ